MSSGHKLVDYFLISGLNVVSGLEPDQLSEPGYVFEAEIHDRDRFYGVLLTGDNLHCPPLERPFKSRVLAHYPEAVASNPFDEDAVCMLCHPNGLRFQTQREPREPFFHSFLITREDGSRNYGAALTFYEQVDNRQICNAMQTLQDMHMAELSNIQSKTLNPHLGTSVYQHSPQTPRKFENSNQGRVYNMRQDSLLVTKVIGFISQLPLVATYEKILRALLDTILSSPDEADLPLESYVYNLIHEVPLPPPGSSLRLNVVGKDVVCQRPGYTDLPLLDLQLHELFNLLGVDNVLSLFSCVLLEHQILLFSKDYQRLMLVSEGITSLAFPFQWQHVYVPILPASLSHFLDAPVPFIMGLHRVTADSKKDLQLDTHVNMCIVDLDTGTIELPEELPLFPHHKELKQDLQHELRRLGRGGEATINGHQRDSGFIRESFIGPEDSGMSSAEGSTSSSMWSIPNKLELLQQNETVAKITALAKKTGVISSLDDINDTLTQELHKAQQGNRSPSMDKHTRDLIVNSSIREIFLHYFLQIFCSYESFVIQLNQDLESWLTNRESMQNFDRASFLSDHPETHLPFLSAFIETQMFTSYIDNKILSQWEDPELNLHMFETRLRAFKEDMGDQRIRRFYHSGAAKEAESLIEKRAAQVDYSAPLPHVLEGVTRRYRPGIFPILHHQVLNKEPANRSKRSGGKWQRDKVLSERHSMTAEQKERFLQETRNKGAIQPKLTDMNPAAMVQTNWKFVETLLKEVKAKTKRMLVEKMGQEAVELGHGEASITAAEENTLIASLCDLLERIWSHGLQQKQGRSALWSFLVNFQEVEEAQQGNKPIDPNHLTPAMAWCILRRRYDYLSTSTFEGDMSQNCPSGMQTWPIRRHRRKPSRGLEMPVLNPLPFTALTDIKNVLHMTDIKTDVGHARAFVRLALEKKVLAKYLKELTANADLLRSVYKRYAFLRCEDEREQFMFHLLSLNAVDYYCFTNTFTTTVIPYRILIFPRLNSSGTSTTANCYCSISGKLGVTEKISIPKHTLDITVQNKNLGVLTTLSIGHDNAGMSPKWLLEHVLVRNEVTGHTYRFPCGRWLGRGVDDSALERLLVAEQVPPTTDHAELMEKCRTPPRCRSPSMPRKSNEPRLQTADIQEMLGDAVNNLVKHFYKPEKERGSLTSLLCGEYGLVYCMEHVFQCGFKSSRLFRNRLFVWEFLEKVQSHYESLLSDKEHIEINSNMKKTMNSFNYVISKINQASESIGKDGRFQIFICIGIRDRWLQHWIRAISKTPITGQMFEDLSFLRDKDLVHFLIQILEPLREFSFVLEASIIKGVEL